MTRVIVNDASCLIDLRKARLLPALCDLPHRLVVPLPVRESEILDFTKEEWRLVEGAGMITHDLTAKEIGQALTLKGRNPGLSANDCCCLVTTLAHVGILLTGDSLLRKVATEKGVRVHGVLWVIDELDRAQVCSKSLLVRALRIWQDDRTVFLPRQEISNRLDRFTRTATVAWHRRRIA